MAKWIKNVSGGDKTYLGQTISNNSYYQVTTSEDSLWANDSTLLIDIANGDALVARDDSGNNDITDVNKGINHLKDLGIVKFQQAVAEDEVTDRPYGWESFVNPANQSTVTNLKFEEAGLYLGGGVLYTADSAVGDYVSVKVVDVDGVYYPAGTVIKDYVHKWPVSPLGSTVLKSTSITSAAIPINVYLQVEYLSKGTVLPVTAIVGVSAYTLGG